MGTLPQAGSVLRLVSAEDAPEAQLSRGANADAARRNVARENRLAAQLESGDARWALAMRARDLLEGGRSAVLSPERRRRLMRLATQVGLRAFDANLIIAIVQDEARTGARDLSDEAAERLAMVRPAALQSRASPWAILAAAGVIAVVGIVLAVRWLTS